MSALQQGEPEAMGTYMIYKWSQPVPCCSYLVALAAGGKYFPLIVLCLSVILCCDFTLYFIFHLCPFVFPPELESREISGRVKVWAEPGVVDAAAFEFSETETFLAAAEGLTCPYEWTRYDVLCLPPSFPYGGMGE